MGDGRGVRAEVRMARRDPRTPSCAFPNCTKAARSFGLCAEHRDLVPYEERLRARLRIMSAQFEAGKREARKIQQLARDHA